MHKMRVLSDCQLLSICLLIDNAFEDTDFLPSEREKDQAFKLYASSHKDRMEVCSLTIVSRKMAHLRTESQQKLNY
jgi:hypothetical protein